MGHRRFTAKWLKLLAVTGLVGSALVGCGEDGDPGPAGPSGAVVAPITGATELGIAVTGVKISSPPVVTFKVTNQNGEQVTGLTADDVRFTIAKLVPGTYGNPSAWQSYINTTASGAYGTRVQATREGGSSGSLAGTFVANGDGTYTYTFKTDITKVTSPLAVPYDPNLTHRVAIQTRGSLPLAAGTYTFRPSDGATSVVTRDIVDTAKCNECHSTLQAHDQRIDTKYCVTCHNPGSSDPDTGNTVDFKVMIHKIHRGDELPSVLAGTPYQIIGFGGTVHDFSDVAFPQDIRNCTKCHDGADPATPQGNNWQLAPSREACGSCHDNVNFETGAGHAGGIKDNSTCLACHSTGGEVGPVAASHPLVQMTNTTPGSEAGTAAFQDKLPAGAKKVEYQIKSVAVNAATVGALATNLATVEFRVLMDGSPVTFNAPGTTPLVTNFTGGPRFYISYAVPMDGITAPADFNYSGNVTLENIWSGAQGTFVSGPDSSGYYKVVVGGGTSNVGGANIPSNAVMVTAWMLYPFVQTNVPGYPGGLTLVTPAVGKVATGYTARRVIAVRENCNNCHATLGTDPDFHGGARNDPTICNICHYPQRTSNGWSGRSNSFIHAIHGASKRTVDFNWHATSATEGYWQIRFPGILNRCATCHAPGAYDFSGIAYTDALMGNLPYSVVASGTMSATSFTRSPYVDSTGTVNYGSNFGYNASTNVTTAAAGTTLATSPIATACFACHDNAPARAHMETYGASIYLDRTTALTRVEECMTCHGPGKVAAIAEMHAK